MKSYEERKAYLKENLKTGMPSMSRGLLKPGSLRLRSYDGNAIGYDFDLLTLFYRGVWLSTMESFRLVVDGEEVSHHDILFRIHDLSIQIDNVAQHCDVFWGTMDTATITVYRAGGLPKGEHTFELEIVRRQDFGHSFGEGTEGYEDASEFLNPEHMKDRVVYTVE